MFTVFTHTELGQGIDPANQQGMGKETGATSADTDVKLGNGAIVDLGLNEKVDFANPGRPNAAFDPFMMAILRQIGMRLGIPYEVLVMHFTASYSAARAALLQAWKFFSVRRYWLACNFCQPVYETFLAEAVALGRISAPGFFTDPLMRMAYCGSEWQGDGMPAIQPMQEAEAIEKRIDIGLTTLQTETAAYDGRDWEANQAQRAREQLARKAAGLLPEPKLPAAAGDAPAEDPGGPSNDYTNATVDAIAGMTNEVKALASRPAPPVNIYHGQPPQTWIFETRPDGTTRVRPEAEEDAQ
jgi:capsid protein